METLMIQITNKKARKLLKDLEDLNLIKVLKEPKGKISLGDKYAGSLPSMVADEMTEYVKKSRKAWKGRNS
jgi:hypothetical protein